MRRILSFILLSALTVSIAVNAQTAGAPVFITQRYSDLGIASKVSDNGKWVIIKGAVTEQLQNGVMRLLNTETKEVTVIKTSTETDEEVKGKYTVNDVTDDGNILVGGFGTYNDEGSFRGSPGIFSMATKTWTVLPLPSGMVAGMVTAVTPDGKYAIGRAEDNPDNVMSSNQMGVMWNLETMSIMNLENLPNMPQDYTSKQETYSDISADGRKLVIFGNQSIVPTCFIYDLVDKSYIRFGRDGNNPPPSFGMVEETASLSPNGKYAAATVRDASDNLYATVLNLETMEYKSYTAVENLDVLVGHVDNNGNVYASSPTTTPIRDWSVVCEDIWYPFSLIMTQRYGRNFTNSTGYDNTGSLWTGSADSRVLASMVSPQGDSYVVILPENIGEACKNIDLLQDFTATPEVNSAFSYAGVFNIRFTQNIAVKGARDCAVLKDKDGNVVRSSMGFAVSNGDSKSLVVTFRETKLNEGEAYTIEIPAGTLCLAANEEKINGTITLNYTGRADVPVRMVSSYPEDGSEALVFDNTTTFPVITFDTKVSAAEKASARLVEVTSDGEKTVCNLAVVAKNENVALMPATTQYLYSGASYKVVLDAGSIMDVTSSPTTGNEEIVLNFIGGYERKISTETAVLFQEDFNNMSTSLANMMRYEGDHRTPTEEMQAWAFDADNQPWNLSVRETTASGDFCAASTSMYTPAGQSDDWIVTPQLQIPDEFCTMTFDAQKYYDLADDRLTVVIWESDENINMLTSEVIERMKAEGERFTYDLSIGKTEEGIEGEYTQYAIDLAKYNGKKIYIGFWNNNNNQSVVFLDNIIVQRNLKYLMYLTNPQSVVNKNEQKIEGFMMINSDIDTYTSYELTLNDTEGKAISTISQSGLSLKKDDLVEFSFDTPLPLTVGEVNNYTIGVKLDTYTDVVKSYVMDLTFEPVKRVVVEEMTGITCPNCPLGILGVENLKSLFGDRVIPISLHTYTGDPYSTSSLVTYTRYLNLNAAPTAMIQRNGYVSSPMSNSTGSYLFTNGADLWLDIVSAEMDTPSYIGVSVPSASLTNDGTSIDMQVQIESALNLKGQYLNVFPVALEDGIVASQDNNLYNISDDNLGDWGRGGKYGQSTVYDVTHNDVARTYWGAVNGTNIGFPQVLEAGNVYSQSMTISYPEQISNPDNGKIAVLVVDGVTGGVINAVVFPLKNLGTGIDSAVADKASDIDIAVHDGSVVAMADENVTLSLYTASGILLDTSTGRGSVTVSAKGHRGTVIVKASTAGNAVTKKLVM